MVKENSAIVLDFLSTGYASSFKKEPIAQALGEDHLTLLELIPKHGVTLQLREKVYIGREQRDKIQFIRGRLKFDKLTATARNELEAILLEKIESDEKKYVDFFNKAGSITIRQHSLELLPSIGKKHMWDIIEAREKKPFESFKDISDRIPLMPDPKRVILERMMEEFKGEEKYYLFIRPPAREEDNRNRAYSRGQKR